MANIDLFILGPDRYDLGGLIKDLLTKMVNDHVSKENAIRNEELCHYYFDPRPIGLEEQFLISSILQQTRGELQKRGWFLDYRKKLGWFIVKSTAEAFDHLVRYTKREVRLHGRLQAKTFIATGNRYKLSIGNPLVQAIQGMTPAVKKLEHAVKDTELPIPSRLKLPKGKQKKN